MKDSSKDQECIESISKVIAEIPSFNEVISNDANKIDITSLKLFISELGDTNAQYKDASLSAQLNANVLLKEKKKEQKFSNL